MRHLFHLYTAFRNFRYPFTLAFMTLSLSFISSIPVQTSLQDFFGHSIASQELFPGIRFGPFMQWLQEFIHSPAWDSMLYLVIFSLVVLLLFRLVLSTGYLYEMYTFDGVRGKVTYTLAQGFKNIIHVLSAFPLWFLISAGIIYGWYRLGRWGLACVIQSGRDELFFQVSGFVLGIHIGLLLLVGILWEVTKIESMRKGFYPWFAGIRAFVFPLFHLPTTLIWFFIYSFIPVGLFFIHIKFQHILLALPFPYNFIEYGLSLILIPYIGAVFKIGLWREIGRYYRSKDGIMARPEGLEPPTW